MIPFLDKYARHLLSYFASHINILKHYTKVSVIYIQFFLLFNVFLSKYHQRSCWITQWLKALLYIKFFVWRCSNHKNCLNIGKIICYICGFTVKLQDRKNKLIMPQLIANLTMSMQGVKIVWFLWTVDILSYFLCSIPFNPFVRMNCIKSQISLKPLTQFTSYIFALNYC